MSTGSVDARLRGIVQEAEQANRQTNEVLGFMTRGKPYRLVQGWPVPALPIPEKPKRRKYDHHP